MRSASLYLNAILFIPFISSTPAGLEEWLLFDFDTLEYGVVGAAGFDLDGDVACRVGRDVLRANVGGHSQLPGGGGRVPLLPKFAGR